MNRVSAISAVSKATIWVAGFYLLVCVLLFIVQRSLLYFPSHRGASGRLKPWAPQGEVIGFCREAPNPTTVWLMLHGNAGQACDREYVIERMSPNDSLYVLEYPGYGQRPGRPSQGAINSAARQAFSLLVEAHPRLAVCIVGESLGSGPACHLASLERKPDKLVLIVPYDSICEVAERKFFFLPVRLLLSDRWDNIAALKSYKGPVEIFAARDDDIIPVQHAERLAKSCPTSILNIVPCGHNDWSSSLAIKISN